MSPDAGPPRSPPKWTNGVIPRAAGRILLQMSVEQAMPGRLVRWLSAAEPDWDAVYADQLPRVYNFFRYRFGVTADAEDLTARTFEKAWRARHRYRRDVAAFSTGCSASLATSQPIMCGHGGLSWPLDEAAGVARRPVHPRTKRFVIRTESALPSLLQIVARARA